MNRSYVPRLAAKTLKHHLSAIPVTTLRGARHTGKATLAKIVGGPHRSFLTLDDPEVARLASRPEAILRGTSPVTIAEIQRNPQLLSAIVDEVDRRDGLGVVLLTAPMNLLALDETIERLRGRGSYLTLWPMTRRELKGLGRAGLWDELLDTPEVAWPDLVVADTVGPEDWRYWVCHGGLPVPALKLTSSVDRAMWMEGYITSYLERDLRAISNVASLPSLRQIMRELALRNGELVNQTHFARQLGVPQPTMHRHLKLLSESYMLVRLRPLVPSRFLRDSRKPRLYFIDTAVGLHLADWPAPNPSHLKSMVLLDLLAWRDAHVGHADVCFWQSYVGDEVDFVLEQRRKLIPITVTTAERPHVRDARGICAFRHEHQDRSCAGLLLHGGEETNWLLPGVLATPWWRVI